MMYHGMTKNCPAAMMRGGPCPGHEDPDIKHYEPSELAKHLDPLHDPARCDVCAMRAAFVAMREALREIAAWEPDRAPDEPKGMSIIDAIDTARAALRAAGIEP